MRFSARIGSAVAAGALVLTAGVMTPAQAHDTGIHDNCTKFNNRFTHGVGMRNAHDRTSGTPVRNFKRNNRIYKRAIAHNSDLDRDKDRIACEQA